MKKFFVLAAALIFFCATCSASTVQVSGQGSTERSAIHNAMRAAIEREVGVQIGSKTSVKNQQLISDEISANSEGFISNFEIISSRVENGIFFVEIKAEVNSAAVENRLASAAQKKFLINTNTDSPRIAVLAYDAAGRQYAEVENEIFSALQRQGFTHTVDLAQVDRAVKNRIASAENDPALRKTLANDFHVDYLVLAEVSLNWQEKKNVTISSKLLSVNTGKIIYAGNAAGSVGMLTANSADASLSLAARRAGWEISRAALNSAAKVEQHLTFLVTESSFRKIGGNLTAANNFVKNIDGVNEAFVRRMSGSIEFDVNFDGTAADFAAELERAGFRVLEVTSDFVKI